MVQIGATENAPSESKADEADGNSEEGKSAIELEAMLRVLFERYDLDDSGRIDSFTELQQLTFNAAFKQQPTNGHISAELIDQVVLSVQLPPEGWDFEQFNDWFTRAFEDATLEPSPPIFGKQQGDDSPKESMCVASVNDSKDVKEFRRSNYSRPPQCVHIAEQEDGSWDCPEVVIFPGDKVEWEWSRDPRLLFLATASGERIESGWNSGALPVKEGCYSHRFLKLGQNFVCSSSNEGPPEEHKGSCCGRNPEACVVRVVMPQARMWPEMLEIMFLLLCMSLIPMMVVVTVHKHNPGLIAEKVVDAAGLKSAPPLDDVVEKVIEDVTPYAVASVTLLVQLVAVAVIAGCCYLMIGLLMPRLFRQKTAGFSVARMTFHALLTTVSCVMLCCSAYYLSREEHDLSTKLTLFVDTMFENANLQVTQLKSISGCIQVFAEKAAAFPGFNSGTISGVSDQVASLADRLGIVGDYQNKAENMIWVHNEVRAVISFLTFETMVMLSAVGLAGVASGCARTIKKAVHVGTLCFALFLIYLGLTIAIKNLFSDTCKEMEPYLSEDGLLAAVNSSGAPPEVFQIFEQCMNDDQVSMNQFFNPTEFLNDNIDTAFSALTDLLPPEVQTQIAEPLNSFKDKTTQQGVPDLSRVVSGTVAVISTVQTYVQTAVDTSGWPAVSNILAPINDRLAQIQAAVIAIEAIFALLDCSTLRKLMADLDKLLCHGVVDQLESMTSFGSSIIVLLVCVVFALMVHGLVMNHPCKHFLCPHQNCGRWFRFRMSLDAHLRVGCKESRCAVFCERTTTSAFYACLMFFTCIPQGLLIFSLQQDDETVQFSVTDLNEQGKGAAVLFFAGILGLFGLVFPLSRSSSWIPLCCSFAGLAYSGYAFGVGTKDYWDQVDDCDGLTGMFQNIMKTTASNPSTCTMANRTNSMKWFLYYAISTAICGFAGLAIMWLFVARNKIIHVGQWFLLSQLMAPDAYVHTSSISDLVVNKQYVDGDAVQDGMVLSTVGITTNPIHSKCEDEQQKEDSTPKQDDAKLADQPSEAAEDNSTAEGKCSCHVSTHKSSICSGVISMLVVAVFVIPILMSSTDGLKCNGHVELCSKTLNQVVYPTAYMSHAASDEKIYPSVQTMKVGDQLEAGIRGLHIAVWPCSSNASLACVCAQGCALGEQKLTTYLGGIQNFLLNATQEVLVLVIDQYIDTAALSEVFESSALDTLAYSPPPVVSGEYILANGWPTLEDLLSNGTQLVVLSDMVNNQIYSTGNDARSWMLSTYDYAWATNAKVSDGGDLDCIVSHGTIDDSKLGIVIHAVTDPVPLMSTARALNTRANLTAHIQNCTVTPNLVSVAFYDFGSVIEVVNDLNIE